MTLKLDKDRKLKLEKKQSYGSWHRLVWQAKRKREIVCSFTSAGSLPRCLQHPWLGTTEKKQSRSSRSFPRWQKLNYLNYHQYLTRPILTKNWTEGEGKLQIKPKHPGSGILITTPNTSPQNNFLKQFWVVTKFTTCHNRG